MLDKAFDEICYSVLFFSYIPGNDEFYISPVVLCSPSSRKRRFAIMFISSYMVLYNKSEIVRTKKEVGG